MDTNLGLNQSSPPPSFSAKGSAAEKKALEMMLRDLNNPALTGAEVPPEDAQDIKRILAPTAPPPDGPQDVRGATLAPTDPALVPAAPTPAAATPAPLPVKVAPFRIVLTGRTGSGKSYLAARTGGTVLELDTPIREIAKSILGNIADGPAADALVATLQAWGDGVVSAAYPLTPARLLFVQWAHVNQYAEFGKPGFWLSRLLVRSAEIDGQAIVTNVVSAEDFRALVSAGFVHYHVVCSSATYVNRPKRKGIDDGLAAFLDQDVTKKLSAQRTGELLRCVWSDTVAPPSARLLTMAHWLQDVQLNKQAAIAYE